MSQPKITTTTRQPMPFLNVPAEIRNLIYNFTFDTCIVTVRTTRTNPYRRGKIRPGLGLAYANRQIHAETALVTYKHITFAFTNIDSITQFLRRRTQDQIHVIQNLQLSVLHGSCLFGDDRHIFSAETLRFMQHFPGLRHMVLIEMGRHKAHVILGQSKRLAKLIRKWRPGAEIDVRDTDGKWMLVL